MTRWKGRRADLDPRPGGRYVVEINDQATARGEYVEIDSPRRIVLTWGWDGEGQPVPPGSSRVEITLEPDGDETVVTLRHFGLSEAMRVEHAKGWDHFMPRLEIAAAGGDPGPDPMEHASNQ